MATAVQATNPLLELSPILRAVIDGAGPPAQANDLAAVIGTDPAFAVQFLQLVNSGLCRRLGRIASVRHAVGLVESTPLRHLAMTVLIHRAAARGAFSDIDVETFWEDTVRRAVAAYLLAERDPDMGIDPLTAFAVGFLLDLGALVLLADDPDHLEEWREALEVPGELRRRIERGLFGASHDAVAEVLIDAWQLPPLLAMPMRYHHEPDRSPPEHDAACRLGTRADLLASVLSCADRRTALDRARQVFALELGWSASDVDDLVIALGERALDVGRAFGLELDAQPTLDSILEEGESGVGDDEALTPHELRQRVRRLEREKDLLNRQLVARERELERLSLTDPLTGLPNHRAVFGRLSYEVSRTARSGGSLALLLGDIDDFRRVNQRWGTAVGNRVLQAVAVALGGSLRQTDIAARVGGEEFAIVLPDTPADGGKIVADKLRHWVASHPVVTPDGEPWAPTISFGLAVLEGPWHGKFDPDEVALRLYSAADVALYESKRTGRDRVTLAEACILWEG